MKNPSIFVQAKSEGCDRPSQKSYRSRSDDYIFNVIVDGFVNGIDCDVQISQLKHIKVERFSMDRGFSLTREALKILNDDSLTSFGKIKLMNYLCKIDLCKGSNDE